MITIYKRLGETPLQALDRLRTEQPELEHETLSYAGRLDPMAEGVLLVLVGDENKHREKYLGLPKTYEAEILFGIETDTYDVLGKITSVKNISEQTEYIKHSSENFLRKKIGTFTQPYPPYSSKPVLGKPLFEWAREDNLEAIDIPTHEVSLYDAVLVSVHEIPTQMLLSEITAKLATVTGDFRQEESLNSWNHQLNEYKEKSWIIVKITVSCSSGMYIRSLIHELGTSLKTGACAFSITRTKVGNYTINGSN